METFDWVARDLIHDVTVGLTLMVVQGEDERSSGHDTDSHQSESEMDEGRGKSEGNVGKRQGVVGDVYIGSHVPESVGVAHWQSMLMQPRKNVIKEHFIY